MKCRVVEEKFSRLVQYRRSRDRADSRLCRRPCAKRFARAERVAAEMKRIDKSGGDEDRYEDFERPARRSIGHRDSVVRHRARYTGFHACDLHLFARARAQSIDYHAS